MELVGGALDVILPDHAADTSVSGDDRPTVHSASEVQPPVLSWNAVLPL